MDFKKGHFQLARSTSFHSTHRYRVGCALSLHGKPVAVGFNVSKSHPTYTSIKNPTIHAEVKAIISARCDLTGATAWVYRETKAGKPAMARPCSNCMELLREVGIKKVVYTIPEEPFWKEEKL